MRNLFKFSDQTSTPMSTVHIRRARELNSAYDRTKVQHGSIAQKAGSIRNILSSLGVDNEDTRVLMYLYPLVRDGAIRGQNVEAKSYNMVNQYFSSEMARELRYLTPQYIIPEIKEHELALFDQTHPEFKKDFQGYLENRIFKRFVELKSTDSARVVFLADLLSYEGRYGSPIYKALKVNLLKSIKDYTALRKESAEENLRETEEYGTVYMPGADEIGNDAELSELRRVKSIWSSFDDLVAQRIKTISPTLHEVHRVAGSSIFGQDNTQFSIQEIIKTLNN